MGFWDFLGGNEKTSEFQERLRKNPDDAEAHFYLGVEYDRIGALEKAVSAFSEVIRINPRSAEGHFNLGTVCAQLKRGRLAIQHMVMAGNLFSERNALEQKDQSRRLLRQYHEQFPNAISDERPGK